MKSNHRPDSHKNGTAAGFSRSGLRFSFLGLLLLIVACGLTVRSQAKVAAGVSGIVTDSSGAVIAGANIQMKSAETGIVESRQRILRFCKPAAGTLRPRGEPDRF